MGTEKQAKESFILLRTIFELGSIKKIVVVVDSIDVNDSSGSKANVAFILNLKEAGFEVKVFHYTQQEIHLPSIECVAIPERKVNGMYLLSRLERLFTRWTGINLNPFLEGFFGFSFTFFNDTSSIVKALRKEINFEPDLVLTLSKGASFRPHYALLKLPLFHHKWMAYVHDPYPFHYYPRPYNWIQPGYKQKEQFFKNVSEKAGYSAFPSLILKEWVGSYFDNFLKTGIVIPHQLSEFKFDLSELPFYFKQGYFTLMHAGNLMKQRSPIALIEGYKKFLEKNLPAKTDSQLLIIGAAGYYYNDLLSYEKEINTLVIRNENIPFNEVLQLQFNVSVNVILESKSEISPFLPGKFPHCVAANKPILLLGPYYSETKRLLGSDYPYWTEADDVIEIAKYIEELYVIWMHNPKKLQLNKPELNDYLGVSFLKKQLELIFNKMQKNIL